MIADRNKKLLTKYGVVDCVVKIGRLQDNAVEKEKEGSDKCQEEQDVEVVRKGEIKLYMLIILVY